MESDKNSDGCSGNTTRNRTVLNENLSVTDVTNSMKVAWTLLEKENLIVSKPEYAIDQFARVIGEGLCESIKYYFEENVLSMEEDLILVDEQVDSTLYVQCTEETSDNEEFNPFDSADSPKDYVSLAYKQKAVAFSRKHPNYSIGTLHRAFSKLKRMETLQKWKEDVRLGGNKFDKLTIINSETYERFKDARENHEQVTTRILQQWAMAAAFPLLNDNFSFIASASWARNLKRKYKIRQRKVTKFISKNDVALLEDTQ